MKIINKHTRFSGFIFIFTVLIFISSVPLEALPPTIIIGAFAESASYKSEGDVTENLLDTGLRGYAGYRFLFGNSSYGVINSGFTVTGIADTFTENNQPVDYEYFNARLSFPSGINRIEIQGALKSSISGNSADGVIIFPEWEALYRFERGRRKINPYAAYSGDYKYSEYGIDNRFSSDVKAGFNYRPVIEHGYSLETGLRFERYADQKLDNGKNREDEIIRITGKLERIFSVFWDFSFEPSILLRNSGLTGYNLIETSFPATIDWSPSRHWSVQMEVSAAPVFYLDYDETDIFLESSLRIDRSFRDKYFLYIESGGYINNSPSLARESWNIFIRSGIDISF